MKNSFRGLLAAAFLVVACSSDMSEEAAGPPPSASASGGSTVTDAGAKGGSGGASSGGAEGTSNEIDESDGGARGVTEDSADGGTPAADGDNSAADGGSPAVDARDAAEESDAGASSDAEEPEVLALEPCDLSAPFEAPVAAFTGSMDADGLTFSADGQRAYISGAGPQGRDLYVATRNSSGAFDPPELLTSVNTSAMERSPAISASGQLHFTRLSGNFQIVQATGSYPSYSGTNVLPGPVNSGYQEEDPFWWNVTTFYFVSEVDTGGAHRDIFRATWNGQTNNFETTFVENVNSSFEEFHPVLSPDGLTLYFASRRPGVGNDTSGDIFMARRPSANVDFPNTPPTNLAAFNNTGIDYPVTISPDGCTLYFASNEETGLSDSANYRLYQAKRGTDTPAQVTLRLNILGQGSVNSFGFNCGPGNTGVCSASAPPDTTWTINASAQAQWTGSCSAQGGQPSTDGVVVFSQNAVCTIKFPGAPLVGPGGLCSLSMDCQAGVACVNNACGGCAGSGTCSDVGETCASDADCTPGLTCGVNNGACFGGARSERKCWPTQCTDGIVEAAGECGQPTSPCGVNCGCGQGCSTDDPTTTCPAGEQCIRDFGRLLGIEARDACGPIHCPSNDPALCGDDSKVCGRHCLCRPNCSQATPANPFDTCGGLCPDICPIGAVGCCEQDYQCQDGGLCLTDPNGAKTCRPSDCLDGPLVPPLCGTPTARCGPECPACVPSCGGRECGLDPNCGLSCGVCNLGEFCDSAGQCRESSSDPRIGVPGAPGGPGREITNLPSAPASGVGAVAGQFSVSEQGTAQYTLPIDVPPGRAGMTPALSLVYSASRDNGSLGVGWRLEGFSKITRCPHTFAVDGFAEAVKSLRQDLFCIDGKRLVALPPGNYGADGTEYRTQIESFAKITSYQEQGPGIQPSFPAGAQIVQRQFQGPDSFEVRTKDGRIMTFGGTLDSLVIGQVGSDSNAIHGVRQAWLLKRIEDRSGNTIEYAYGNYRVAPRLSDGRLVNIAHPTIISYTGHGNSSGNRSVRFTYETRTDPALRFLHGGIAWGLGDRLKRITTYVGKDPVKNYRLDYDPATEFSQLRSVFECEGDGDERCKLPTQFDYESATGYEYVEQGPGFLHRGQLDVNGDGFPDFFRTTMSVEGTDGRPDLMAAQVATDIAITVGTSLLQPEIGIPIAIFWAVGDDTFWGILAGRDKPEVKIDNVVQFNPQTRGVAYPSADASGIPCDRAHSFQDYNRDGRDDVISACSEHLGLGEGQYRVRAAISLGDGNFDAGPTLFTTPMYSQGVSSIGTRLPPPIFFDVDGDSLQDVIYCEDLYTLKLKRRLGPNSDFEQPVALDNDEAGDPICYDDRPTVAIFDIDGDGTPDLVTKYGDQWKVLRFFRVDGEKHIRFDNISFPDVGFSSLGEHLEIADFNNDGLPDVLSVDGTYKPAFPINAPRVEGRNATIWLNSGTGQFFPRQFEHPIVPNSNLKKVALVDYNDDGRLDWIENWLMDDATACGAARNAVFLPNSSLDAFVTLDNPEEFLRIRRVTEVCGPEAALINFAADFDADGSMDLHAGNEIYYGKGGRNLLLSRIQDGLGNVTTIAYDGPGTYDGTCGSGSTWPEMCLKHVSGLVREYTEGHTQAVTGASPVVERKYQFEYSDAHVSATGHGWLGFARRKIYEIASPGVAPPETQPPDSEFPIATTTIEMEPITRTNLLGEPWPPAAPSYIYPLAGLPKTIEIEQSKAKTLLESAAFRRRTRIENVWEVRLSDQSIPFPHLRSRTTRVFEAVSNSPPDVDGSVLASCTETMTPDAFGNIEDRIEDCSDGKTETHTTFITDSSSWLISNPDVVTAISFDSSGSSQSQIWDFDYYPNGLLLAAKRTPNGAVSERHASTYVRNAFGNVEQVVETVATGEAPRTTTITYDSDDVFPLTITNPKGHTSQVRFDKRWGVPTTLADPNGIVVQRGYDGLGMPYMTRDPEGVTVYTYSRIPRDVQTSVGVVQSRVTVTAARQGIDGTRSGETTQELDNRGRPVITTTEGFGGVGVLSELAYDVRGRLTGATSPHTPGAQVIPRTFYSYDGLDRLKRVARPDIEEAFEIQHASRISLDPQFDHWFRFTATECGENGLSCPLEVERSVDEEVKQNVVLKDRRGRIMRSIDGDNVATTSRWSSYRYGPFNRLAEIQQNRTTGGASAPRTLFTHDAYGRLLSLTDPDSGETTYTYNGYDEVRTSLDAKSQLRTFTHDELGRLTSIVDGTQTSQWIYDQGINALGRISETISPATPEAPLGQHIVYTYEPPIATNNRGLLARLDYIIDSTVYPIGFTYDAHGRTDTVRYPDLDTGPPVVAKYTYDVSGFLTDVEEIGSGTTRPVWHMNSAFEGQHVQFEIFGNGAGTTYGYDHHRRFVTSIFTNFETETIQDLRYTYYKNGQVRERIRNGTEMRVHHYDALRRLWETTDTSPSNPAATLTYGYDHLGNLTQRGATTLTRLPERPHLLDMVGGNNYQYDENGNVERRAGPDIPGTVQTIDYTPFDLPKQVVAGQTGATQTTRFEYSADEERLVRRDDDKTRHFVTDLYQRLTSSTGALLEERFRLYAGAREVAQIVRQDGVDKTLYFHPNNLGTPEVVSTSESEVFRQEFDPFGASVDVPSTEVTRSGFTGHEHDRDLGLIDMKGRVYDPLAGSFTTADPIIQAPFWSQGLNRYAYVFNDPVNYVDPSGMMGDSLGSGAGILTAGLMTGGLGSVAYQGFDAGMINPLGAIAGGIGVGNIALKLITGTGYADPNGTEGRSITTGGPGIAPTTNPGANGMNALNKGTINPPVLGPDMRLAEGGTFGGAGASGSWDPATPDAGASSKTASDAIGLLELSIRLRGSLRIVPGHKYSDSELRAAVFMMERGHDVVLRPPSGTRAGGGTSDLLVDGVPYDVYTPKTSNPNRIISAIARKNSQASGIVLDLSETSVTKSQLGNVLKRVRNAGAKNIREIVVIGGR